MLESQLEKWILSHAASKMPLAVVLPSGQRIELGSPARVVIHVKDLTGARLLFTPTLANLGTGYVEGHLDIDGEIDDLIDVAVTLARSTGGDDFTEPGLGLMSRLLSHSKKRDRESIEYHYDVSNDFYRLFLDQAMVYSCGYFKEPSDSLDLAQQQKLDHILTKLMLKPGDRLLDVGSGWGALAIRAAERGAKVVGVTLSQRQYEYSLERIAALGLSQSCEIRLEDYRDLKETARFNKIVSVGMFEHVGQKHLPSYFTKMHALLENGGAMLMHGITATDPNRRLVGHGGSDFIDRYVFPDGELPHVTFAMRAIAEAGFEVVDVESLRRHYALTLNHWAHRLESHADAARKSGGDKRYRIWRVYLAGCGYGFAHNWMNINQMLCCKLGPPQMNPFPMTRDWMYRG
jgi:cyclopropane-fatty-acyl-phospholipid synthase